MIPTILSSTVLSAGCDAQPWGLLANWQTAIASNWALISIAVTIGVLILVPCFILRRYVEICFNIFDTVPPLSLGFRHNGPLPGETVDFRALDGHALRGIIIPRRLDQPWRGLIIFAHEFGSDRSSCMRYCGALLEGGYDVLALDFRGHGESTAGRDYKPRQWPSEREQADMLGAIAFAEDYLERYQRPLEIGIVGISRGAGAAILAAQSLPQVKAIVADGAFSSDTTLEYFMRRWAGIFAKVRIVYENHPPVFWRFMRWRVMRRANRRFGCSFPSVRKALRRLDHTAILFIHGERDSYIPVSQSEFLYNLKRGSKYLWLVPGARHNEGASAHPHTYADFVLRFFDQHLAQSPAGLPALPMGIQLQTSSPEQDNLVANGSLRRRRRKLTFPRAS